MQESLNFDLLIVFITNLLILDHKLNLDPPPQHIELRRLHLVVIEQAHDLFHLDRFIVILKQYCVLVFAFVFLMIITETLYALLLIVKVLGHRFIALMVALHDLHLLFMHILPSLLASTLLAILFEPWKIFMMPLEIKCISILQVFDT